MKHFFLLLTLLTLLLTACGGTPTPDIEATVQAAVAATQAVSAIEATVQAAVAATQAAQSTATLAPEPTNTPVPPTNTPMPTPPTYTPVPEPVGDDTPTPPTTIKEATGPVACTYYVAPGGSDDAPGTQALPWATFQHAADTAGPGDAVCFRGGTYPTDETHLTRSGTAEALITFIAFPSESPILDGGGNAGGLLILNQGTSYLRISGFTLRNFTIWGMELSGENRYVQLDHLDIGGGEASIHFTYGESAESPPAEGPVEHITLEDSTIHGSQYSAVDCTPGPCNHMVIRQVEIYNT